VGRFMCFIACRVAKYLVTHHVTVPESSFKVIRKPEHRGDIIAPVIISGGILLKSSCVVASC